MPIKNKDGSTYIYSKPNPIMQEQNIWDDKDVAILHNKFGQRYVSQQKTEYIPTMKPEQEENEIEIVESIDVPPPKYVNEDIIEVWCLPCLNSQGSTVTYGDTFKFKAKLLKLEDLYVQFIAQEKISDGSIVYPKTNSKRWWKVRNSSEVQGFHVMVGVISDYQPSFE